jgi:deoxyribodipyrimidine photo-lyase
MTHEEQSGVGIYVGKDFPQPIVEITIATKKSKDRLYARRNLSEVRAGKKSVIDKHASRAKKTTRKIPKVKTPAANSQLTLEL